MEQFSQAQGPALPRKRRRRWPWIVAGGAVALLLTVGLVNAIVNESAKISRVTAVADTIPAPGWTATYTANPQHDITCIPFGQSCHSLRRTWTAAEPVDLQQLVDLTGYDLEIGTVYRPDCAEGYEGRIRIRICVDGDNVELDIND